ncbi:MAG: Ada metal-binding domain-containing protein [Thermoanaerobaculia bacterium]
MTRGRLAESIEAHTLMKRQSVSLLVALVLLGLASAVLAAAAPFHGNTSSKVFHASTCQHYDCKNCTVELKTFDEAIDRGFRPCKLCRPSSAATTTRSAVTASYVGNTSSMKLHRTSCRHASCANCTARFSSRDDAIKKGYVPGRCCSP